MLILLPPSETKRTGGPEGTRLDYAALSWPELTQPRRAAVEGVRKLSRNLAAATERAAARRHAGRRGRPQPRRS